MTFLWIALGLALCWIIVLYGGGALTSYWLEKQGLVKTKDAAGKVLYSNKELLKRNTEKPLPPHQS